MKTKTLFVCQSCGSQAPRWAGRCSECGSWNSYVEEQVAKKSAGRSRLELKEEPVLMMEVATEERQRLVTGIAEFDRVLGGGIIPGSVTLIGGDPGIGKSTLALQMSCALSQQGHKVLYVSGDESIQQAKMRADRLIGDVTKEGIVAGTRDLEHIVITVLYFEGNRYTSYRVFRANKNRFGPTNE